MSINHHLLAKTTTDSILGKFKSGLWVCCGSAGSDFYRVGCDSTFPSPDAAFYEGTVGLMVSFEFKPPTETKRGILTGLGQSIAYLQNSNLSYLIVPERLEDYELGAYMSDLFGDQLINNLPIGLITYDNDNPSTVSLIHNVHSTSNSLAFNPNNIGRFWAKHQDLPIPLFHLILHCYYLKKIHQINGDAFAYCWDNFIVPPSVLTTLNPFVVLDVSNNPIKTLSGRKNIAFFEKKLAAINKLNGSALTIALKGLANDRDSSVVGDNYYNSIKKNFVTFLKHLGLVDSTSNLTEDGFKLYHLGLVNGPNSKIFQDYFLKTILLQGHHLDLIFDLEKLCTEYRGIKDIKQIKELMEADYQVRGMIKRNPNRLVSSSSSVEFLKYEFILWNSLGLIITSSGMPDISFNWKMITEVCSLPDL
ncbi:MAG: hypothetical protein ACHQHN_15555 [Sphingobacteriales bacterium]